MIPRLTTPYVISPDDQIIITSIMPFDGNSWNRVETSLLREQIHDFLLRQQHKKCGYCGLNLNTTGRAEIDHILAKGGVKRPNYVEYVYTPANLVLSCQFCNSSSKKGQKDISLYADKLVYSNCTFAIVHPYFDDPTLHYRWTNSTLNIVITAISPKGRESVRIFGLDSEEHTIQRASQKMFERRQNPLTRQIVNRIKHIMSWRP